MTKLKTKKCRIIVAVLFAGMVLSSSRAYAQWSYREGDPEVPRTSKHLFQPFTKAEWEASNFAPAEDLQWFRDAKIGFLAQFGLSTHNNAETSWGMCWTRKRPDGGGHGPIPDAIWPGYAKELKFEKFNAGEWVEIMQRAGFKYCVMMAKHHEGFHWWDTQQSDFKVTNTPLGRDILKELADTCHAAHMRFGLYYAQREWYHPDYFPVDYHQALQRGIKPSEMTGNAARHIKYLDYNKKAVRELLTNYGQVDVFWWDAAWWGGMFTADMWDAENLTRMVRELQPHILQNNRISVPGDFDTPEQRLGHYRDWRPWETCMPLAREWGNPLSPLKPLDSLIKSIVRNSCNDGNTLIGFGPQWDGSFTEAQKQRLFELGDWLKEYGTAIYGTRSGPWKSANWGGSTRRGKSVFLHLLDYGGALLRIPALPQRQVLSARILGGEPVAFKQSGESLEVTVPMASRKAPVTIVELTMDQPVDAIPAIPSGMAEWLDELAYGKVVSTQATVTASSYDEKNGKDPQTLVARQCSGTYLFQTATEAKPWVQVDLGRALNVTAVRLTSVPSGMKELNISISTDGVAWTEAGKVKASEKRSELALTRFLAGAWIPGQSARYVRVELMPSEPASLSLRHVEIWCKD